jgi:hypothetical protein
VLQMLLYGRYRLYSTTRNSSHVDEDSLQTHLSKGPALDIIETGSLVSCCFRSRCCVPSVGNSKSPVVKLTTG